MRTMIWIGVFVGSTIGSYVPTLWGDEFLSMASIFFSGIGAFAGIWLGYRVGKEMGL